ncbi:hypothetical protein CSA08_04460 [Candidatus Gracilibacteria bacterium]|nr:MAG: hypothetical protein CSA08_04460 [Candidatus Gracilibacteria bacterium]
MKKHEIIFGAIKVPLDFIIIFSSFFLAREIRLITDLIPNVRLPIQTIDTNSLFIYATFGALLYVILFATHSLYNIKITSSKIKEIFDIIRYGVYWFIFFGVSIYLSKGPFYDITEIPRLIILFTFILGTIFVILERLILNNIQYLLLKKGFVSKKNILIINNKNDEEVKNIVKDIKNSKIYNIIGYLNKNRIESKIKYIGNIDVLQKLFEKRKIDEILYIDSDFGKKYLFYIWDLSRIFGIRYRYITNSFDITKTNTSLSLINNIPVIEIKNTSLDNWGRIWKRIIDIIGSILGIIIFAPLMILVGIAIKIGEPKSPVIYKNSRIGQNGKVFNLYKFRYMKWEYCTKDSYKKYKNNDKANKLEEILIKKSSSRKGPLYKIKNDPRKTNIGKIIEKYSIDELPQLFNVIIGDMSLIGPRPHQPREVEKYTLHQKRLLTIKPGITGMAQVNGREKNDFETETKLDIFYIENWSLLLDTKILLKTFSTIFKR